MSNYIEYNDKIAFHPGYYIKEIIEESGLSQKDFAKRLDTTPKNLSILVRGEQSLSIDIAMKLSRMLGTLPACQPAPPPQGRQKWEWPGPENRPERER